MGFLLELLGLGISFLGVTYYVLGNIDPVRSFYFTAAILFIGWLVTIALNERHKPKFYQKKLKYIASPFIKAWLIYFILTTLLILIFNLNTWYIAYVTISVFSLAEIVLIILLKYIKRNNSGEEDVSVSKFKQNNLNIRKIGLPIITYLVNEEQMISEDLFEKLYENVKSTRDQKSKVLIFDSKLTDDKSDFIHLKTLVNNLKEINSTFKKLHHQITNGGYLTLKYYGLDELEASFKKLSAVKRFFRYVHFYIYQRAFPKIKGLSLIYKIFSGEKNKVISKAEVWGRLAYHGFDVISEERIDNQMTVLIAKKIKTVSDNPNPSHSPLIRLNRVGYRGKIIKVYKIRSMYPYSEFLQQKVYELNKLSNTGKFNEDFRITKYGKIFRKYWIDELPQFFDWLRGEIKLVGIRAMSQQFFNLYSKEYKELYKQVKPGIFSPIFDETNDSFEKIENIEQKYLESYLKQPIATDFKYIKIVLNHILKGVRSK